MIKCYVSVISVYVTLRTEPEKRTWIRWFIWEGSLKVGVKDQKKWAVKQKTPMWMSIVKVSAAGHVDMGAIEGVVMNASKNSPLKWQKIGALSIH